MVYLYSFDKYGKYIYEEVAQFYGDLTKEKFIQNKEKTMKKNIEIENFDLLQIKKEKLI